MPRKSKNGIQPIGVGLTAKQMKRRKPINADMLRVIEPLTENQKKLFESYDEGKNLIAYGVAGTGKTFISLYKALCDVFNPETPYEKIYIVRSLVATREIGFLPGKAQETISFWSTSFIRGTTLDKAIVIVDEFQNLNFHELDSIMTRVGENSKIMFCGDATQSDLIKDKERNGIADFMQVLRIMSSVDVVEFGIDDIVRSGLVKEYLLAKLEMGI